MRPIRSLRSLLTIPLLLLAAEAGAQGKDRSPHLGYLYPAGGRQGSVVQVVVGGQFLNGASDVRVTGEGVSARVTIVAQPINNERLRELRQEFAGILKMRNASQEELAAAIAGLDLPEHPLLYDLGTMSLREIEVRRSQYFDLEKRQVNPQISELLLLEVTIDPLAPPGDREVRISAGGGLTNPLCFQVSAMPEEKEHEPNDEKAASGPRFAEPVVINGQIMPGDVDRFRFRARQGRTLVIEAQARRLIPYLADAVPGWFQATLAIYDSAGREVAFADDFRFDPDPILAWEAPADGEYELEIRDSLYRGRADFVYRVSLAERPFITRVLPMGGRAGEEAVAAVAGVNLGTDRLALDTSPGGPEFRVAALETDGRVSNPVPYAVDTLPEVDEAGPNDDAAQAQPVALPVTVNGRIERTGDIDVFRFQGRAGEEVAAEVIARRLRSPLDSLLRLLDESGKVLAWNDDSEDKESGLLTHHADSRLLARLPADGVYRIELSDTQHHGGEEYGYRLRIAAPRPDFALRMTPASVNLPPGGVAEIRVHALRKDGFDGDIEVVLAEAPSGFVLAGGRIPRGRDSMRMTIAPPRGPFEGPVRLRLEGRARVAGTDVTREVVPTEDLMQAFLYRHLVPAQELLLAAGKSARRAAGVRLADPGPVRLAPGGTARVQVRIPANPKLAALQLELSDPPKGVTLQSVAVTRTGLELVLAADGEAAKGGVPDNLIVEAFVETEPPTKEGKPKQPKRRVAVGVLPAIPLELGTP